MGEDILENLFLPEIVPLSGPLTRDITGSIDFSCIYLPKILSVEDYDFIRNLINETLEKIKDKPANIAITKEDLTTLLTQILDKLEN